MTEDVMNDQMVPMHSIFNIAFRKALKSVVVFMALIPLTASVVAQPANDNPCGATVLAVGATCVNTAGTIASATNSGVPAPSCAGAGNNDVWYTVTVPASGSIDIQTTAGTMSNAAMAIYTAASCAGPFTQVACNDNYAPGNMPRIILTCQTGGTVLYVRIWRAGGSGSTFNICAVNPGLTGATNNEPCTATGLAVNTTCMNTTGTNLCASLTAGPPAPGCGNLIAGSLDVWFSFVAPASGIADINTTTGTLADGAMAVYSAASCAGPFTMIECDDDDGPGLMPYISRWDLVPGQTYWIRFWGFGSLSGTFSICVTTPVMPAGSCVYGLEMFDSGSNGWGSSNVGVSINGGPFTNYTVTGAYNVVFIGLNIGDILVVQYNASGPNQTQNRYLIRQVPGASGVFVSGTPPAGGVVYTETVDCVPPPAPAEDCIGGATVCNGQSFNGNTNNTGFVSDLSTANRGCLASSERQGTWYHFSPSAGGTIGFTIAPTNPADDYDFAVWGPTGSISCPPPTVPYRCSYAALTGNTGCGNGAVDVSENSGGDKWVSTFNVITGEVYTLYVSNWSQSGLAFSLTWDLTNGASLDCTVLPVEMLSFEAAAITQGIELRWSTATELDNDRFIIERSSDGVDFQPIGQMPGAGTTHSQTDYFHLDPDPVPGINYYRLVQIDLDGASEHSAIVSAIYRPAGAPMVIYPNPSQGDITLATYFPEDGIVTVKIGDLAGRTVLLQTVQGRTGSAEITVPTQALESGHYQIELIGRTGQLAPAQQFIKR